MPGPEKATRQEVVVQLQKRALATDAWQSCVNCDHWGPNQRTVAGNPDPGPMTCLLFRAQPPAETIVVGCASWTGFIPF